MTKTIQHLTEGQLSLSDQLAAQGLFRSNPAFTQSEVYRPWVSKGWMDQPRQADLLIGLDSIPFYNDQLSTDSPSFIQRARFYSDKVVIYPRAINHRVNCAPKKGSLANLAAKESRGFISKSAGNVIRKRLESWIKAIQINKQDLKGSAKAKHSHVVFATLTLPSRQVHGDNEIKRKCLMPFLQQIKRLHGVDQYFWSAEPMESGDLHFHCLFDRYIAADRLQDLWNSATDHLGYLGRYMESGGSCNPPSVKINACPENMSLVKYVLKYVSKQPRIEWSHSRIADRSEVPTTFFESEEIKGGLKEVTSRGLDFQLNDCHPWDPVHAGKVTYFQGKFFRWYQRRSIEGRSWGMSDGLLTIDVCSMDVSYRVRDLREIMYWDSSVKFQQRDHCEIFYCNVHDMLLKNDHRLLEKYRDHYKSVYRQLYVPQSAPVEDAVPVYSLARSWPSSPFVPRAQLRFAI